MVQTRRPLYGVGMRWSSRPHPVDAPTIAVGNPAEYAYWVARLSKFLEERGAGPDLIDQVDARYNYRQNRITLYRLRVPAEPLSVAETISHEFLHALLNGMGEWTAARQLDLVARPARGDRRVGGI